MFRHVVLFRFKDGCDPNTVSAALDGLLDLPEQIDEIRSYTVGRDVGLAEGNFDAGIVADFDEQAGFVAYRDHPLHVEHAKNRLGPLIADRASVQFEL